MDALPLVSEIRDARRRHGAVQGAHDLLQRVEAARMALGVIERQHASHPGRTYKRLPGDDLFDDVSDRFTELADLATPARTTPDRALPERRRVLDALAAALTPLATEERTAAERLHQLRHDQHHALKDPRYADAMATLNGIVAERDAVYAELTPKVQRVTAVGPSRHLMEHLRTELAWVEQPIEGNRAVAAYRAVAVATGLLDVLRRCLADTGFDLPVPPGLPQADAPDPDQADAQLDWVRTQLGEVANLEDALRAQSEELDAEVQALQRSMDHHNQRIEEMLG